MKDAAKVQQVQKVQNELLHRQQCKCKNPLGFALHCTGPETASAPAGDIAPGFVLELRALPGNWRADPVQRLRGALKTLLRAYGLRCTSARPVNPQPKEKTP